MQQQQWHEIFSVIFIKFLPLYSRVILAAMTAALKFKEKSVIRQLKQFWKPHFLHIVH